MTDRAPPTSSSLDAPTRQMAPVKSATNDERVPCLTVLGHPDVGRVGERAALVGLMAGEEIALSRTAPRFDQPGGRNPRALLDPFLSREPIAVLAQHEGRVLLRRRDDRATLRVDGEDLRGSRAWAEAELDRGVVLELADRCVLLLHRVALVQGRRPPSFDLVGDGDAMRQLRREIDRVSQTGLRVLIRGESGTGKELVAGAIHRASDRSKGPFEAVNMGALPPSLAASALFGHVRGAFSGAVSDQDGHFAAAHGGSLFLDEIGDTDANVQAMMLRTLETGELVRVGDRRPRKIDVRILSATDADLEADIARGRFREPLFHRLAEISLRVPSLRERRDDLGRLIVHFLRQMLGESEQAALLDHGVDDRAWLSPNVVARLARAPWPGNVRQLRNVVRQLVVLARDEPALTIPPAIEALLLPRAAAEEERAEQRSEEAIPTVTPPPFPVPSRPSDPLAGAPRKREKRPRELRDEDVLEALARTGWKREAAARELGVSRSTLYALIANNPRIARANDLPADVVTAALAHAAGDLVAAAAALKVSAHALKLRAQALSIDVKA